MRLKSTLLLSMVLLTGCASDAPIALKSMGSFHVGGREVTISGKPMREVTFTPGGVPAKVDPNGVYQVEQMYVQYFIPYNQRGALPLLMWHGGGLTGVTYETTPDGREGWLNDFVKKGWPVYNSDAAERGRSGWAMYPDVFKGEPVFLTKEDPFMRFRIGAGPGSFNSDPAKMKLKPGSQFPAEGYNNFTKQGVPRWPTIRGNQIKFLEQVKAAGGRYEVIDLPKFGLRGNSHMIMMDKNSDQVAGIIQAWLEKQGLYR